MGKPRNQRRLIQVYMDWDKLCNFRLKKVYDKRVIEHMTRFDRGMLRLGSSPEVYGGWDNTDESKKEIEEWVELLNRAYSERRSEAKKGAPRRDAPRSRGFTDMDRDIAQMHSSSFDGNAWVKPRFCTYREKGRLREAGKAP